MDSYIIPGQFIHLYKIISPIQNGKFGSLYRVISPGGNIYSLKAIKKSSETTRDSIQIEFHCLCLVQSVYTPTPICFFEDTICYYIVMEYLNGKSLLQIYNETPEIILTSLKAILTEIIMAIGHCHSRKVVHGDIKLDNIILIIKETENKRIMSVKLVDFGISEVISSRKLCAPVRNKKIYRLSAPEVFKYACLFFVSDYWSVGVMLYFILYNKYPAENGQMCENVIQELAAECNEDREISNERDLIRQLMKNNIDERLGFRQDWKEVLEHPFFADIESIYY